MSQGRLGIVNVRNLAVSCDDYKNRFSDVLISLIDIKENAKRCEICLKYCGVECRAWK